MLIFAALLLIGLLTVAMVLVFKKIIDAKVNLATKHLDELNQVYTKKEEEIGRQEEEVKQKAEEVIDKAREEAEQVRLQIIKEAEAEKDKVIKASRIQAEEIIQKAEKSRQALLSDLEERISKEGGKKACELIENNLPEDFKRQVHSQWIEDLIEGGFGQVSGLRVPQDVHQVKVVSAFGLSDEQRKKIAKKLKETLGRELELKEEVDLRVIAGVAISIGSLVLDGTLKNKIEKQTR